MFVSEAFLSGGIGTLVLGGPEMIGVALELSVLLQETKNSKEQQRRRMDRQILIADCRFDLAILLTLAPGLIGNWRGYSSRSSSTATGSFCSWGSGSPATRYSPSTHRPRSTSWHRSEQKGRKGLSFHSIDLPQVGHFISLEAQTAHLSIEMLVV
jgi:hypothetical protein